MTKKTEYKRLDILKYSDIIIQKSFGSFCLFRHHGGRSPIRLEFLLAMPRLRLDWCKLRIDFARAGLLNHFFAVCVFFNHFLACGLARNNSSSDTLTPELTLKGSEGFRPYISSNGANPMPECTAVLHTTSANGRN